MTNILIAKQLTKTYHQRAILKGVSLNVKNNEIVGLLGPNGAGKTTCFYIMAGLIPANSGTVSLNQQNITHIPLHARAKLGLSYLPQEASVFRKLTVRENILSILEIQPNFTLKTRLEKLEELLKEFNLIDIQNTLGISLSGGERRRTEIARLLACEPKFILLDEPFAGVDPISVQDIKQQILYLKARGIGILITDHNVRETLTICDRAAILNEGSLLTTGSPQDILQNPVVRQVYLGEEFAI